MRNMIAALWLLGLIGAASAADNAITLTPGAGVTEASKDIGAGVQSPRVNVIDATGNNCFAAAGASSICVLGVQGVSGGISLPASVNTWATGVLGAMANYGTTPGAVLVPGVNAFITNTPTVSVPTWAGGTLGAMANYGTTPGAVLVPGVNAFVTNTNANGQATAANSSPVVLPATQVVTLGGATTANSVPVILNSQYPVNSVTTTPAPITGNSTGSTGAVVGTLSGAANVTTFICGFNVSVIGGTAAIGPITVAGLIGSSQVYQYNSTAAAGQPLTQNFNPCIPASATNTSITITTTADGTATAVDVNSWGYRL